MKRAELVVKAVRTSSLQQQAHRLVVEYLHWFGEVARLRHGLSLDIPAMIRADLAEQATFTAPDGLRVAVKSGGAAVGVGSFRAVSHRVIELRRMYVQPASRAQGAGGLLLDRLLNDARSFGHATVRLETVRSFTAAHALYRTYGFHEIAPYRDHACVFGSTSFAAAYRREVISMERSVATFRCPVKPPNRVGLRVDDGTCGHLAGVRVARNA